RQYERQHPDIERHPTAVNDPAQHVAPEHIRPQRMLPVGQRHGHTTAGGRRFIGRQHVCQDGGQHEHNNDPYANERGAFAPQLPPRHRLETLPRSDRLGYFYPLIKNNRLTHALLLSQRASPRRLPPWLLCQVVAIPLWPACYVPSFPY